MTVLNIPPSSIALFSIFLFNCVNVIIGYSTNVLGMSVFQLMFIQSASTLIIALVYVLAKDQSHGIAGPPETRMAVWSIGVLQVLATVAMYVSLQQLTLSEHVTVACTLPFATALLSWVWLGDRLTRAQVLCCVLSVFGVALIVDPFKVKRGDSPSSTSSHGIDDGIPGTLYTKLVGIGLCGSGMFLLTIQLVLTRHISERASTAQILVIVNALSGIAAPLFMLVTRTPIVLPLHLWAWTLLAALMLINTIATATLTYATQRTSPTTVTICTYAGIAFATLSHWILYGNVPSALVFVGMGIVLLAGLYGVIADARKNAGTPRLEQAAESQVLIANEDSAETYWSTS